MINFHLKLPTPGEKENLEHNYNKLFLSKETFIFVSILQHTDRVNEEEYERGLCEHLNTVCE